MALLERLPPEARVAVVRLRSLGDCVLTTPALAILKRALPQAKIAVAVEERFAPVFEGNPDLAAILSPDWRALRRWRPLLAINLHGGTRSMVLTALSGARYRAGFAHHRYSWIYNQPIPRAQEVLGVERRVHTAEHLASAIFHLGAPVVEIPRAKLYAEPAGRTRPYAVLHPMASEPGKTWPHERFVEVARHLEAASGLEPVFIAGPGEDLSAFGRWPCFAGAPLTRIKSLLSGATLFVGNDSGPAHMAAAFGVPVVVLFGTSDPLTWAPWRTSHRVLIAPEGIAAIPAARVIEALESLKVAA
jgi:heptosyltransferase III